MTRKKTRRTVDDVVDALQAEGTRLARSAPVRLSVIACTPPPAAIVGLLMLAADVAAMLGLEREGLEGVAKVCFDRMYEDHAKGLLKTNATQACVSGFTAEDLREAQRAYEDAQKKLKQHRSE